MKYLTLFCFFLFFANLSQAQEKSTLEESLKKLESYHSQFPREKVYLHLDKPYYSIGDQIWFKAYLTIGNYNYLSTLSKVLYVELINPDNEVALSVRLPVLSGITFGDILLKDSLSEGNYRIRAYSSWMRNFDEKYYFDKMIPVGNALKNPVLTESSFSIIKDGGQNTIQSNIAFKDLDNKPFNNIKVDYSILSDKKSIRQGKETTDEQGNISFNFKEPKGGLSSSTIINTEIQTGTKKINKQIHLGNINQLSSIAFFPDNGEKLIADILNKVVVKVAESDGLGLAVTGVIKDGNGKEITTFETDFAGIGNFNINPEVNQIYKATISFPDSRTEEVTLPKAEAQGYLINANTWSASQVFIQIVKSDGQNGEQGTNLILQKNGEVFYAAKIKLSNAQTTINIPKDKFPLGIVEARLLGDDMKTLATRELFIYNENREFALTVTPDKAQYKTRDLVKLGINSGKPDDTVKVSSLSISVTDLTQVTVDTLTETTINSYLNLSSESTDYVQSPNYYFRSPEFKVRSQLDDLIQTFEKDSVWQAIKKADLKAKYLREQDLRISGKVTRLNGKAVPFAKVLVLVGGNGGIIDTVADENGHFNFDRLLFYEDTKFVIQARDDKGKKNVEIVLDEVPHQQVSKNKNSPDVVLNANQSMDNYIKNTQKRFDELIKSGKMDKSILLDDVDIKVEKKNPAEHSSNLNGPGNADQVLGEEDLGKCSDLVTCLQGRLMGVMFKNKIPYSTRSMDTPMQVIVDGMYLEGDALSMMAVADVASVEVLRRPMSTAMYGGAGAGGVLIITTKIGNGSYNKNLYTPGIVTYSPQGLYEIKEFNSPDYSVQSNSNELDLRSTIYWNPNIVTDKDGKASVEFYTADQPGRYRIIIEGIDLDGKIGRSETFIDIVD